MIPTSLDLSTLAAAYREGLDPQALMAAVLGRLEAIDDPGIFLSLMPAETVAGLVAALGPYDPTKPLWGVPFAVKDNIDCAGLPTTAACPAFAFMPDGSAEVVRRLMAAGAIPVGKTNLDQFATGLVGLRTPHPAPRNSFDAGVVPGGSSSGSAVAVARGLVSFALGTDTAGSGRVPAGLNNIVGVKPSLGAVSLRGVLPACQTLDCVSVFALTVPDATRVFDAAAGYDAADPWSRHLSQAPFRGGGAGLRLGVPDKASRVFGRDALSEEAFDHALAILRDLGHTLVEVDFKPFFDTARLLYDGPWVAERYQAIRPFLERQPDALHPTTLGILRGAAQFTAADGFAAQYRLAHLKRESEAVWTAVEALAVPTYPRPVRVADVHADPLGPNAELGTYTNFVNLLDMCGLAVPGPFRDDGFPSGVTLLARAGGDHALAALGSAFHNASGVSLGATGVAQPKVAEPTEMPPHGRVALCVVGAHLTGLPLNGELVALGAVKHRDAVTTPDYRLYRLPGTTPPKPALVRVADGQGHAIAAEVWHLSPGAFGTLVNGIPSPLGIGTIRLADGTTPKGFLGEAVAVEDASDISHFGGWRRYLADGAA